MMAQQVDLSQLSPEQQQQYFYEQQYQMVSEPLLTAS